MPQEPKTRRKTTRPRKPPKVLGDMGGVFEFASRPASSSAKRDRPQQASHVACIWLGKERKEAAARSAQRAGVSLSALVCMALDAGISLPPDLAAKLASLAAIRDVSPAELLEGIVRDALNRV